MWTRGNKDSSQRRIKVRDLPPNWPTETAYKFWKRDEECELCHRNRLDHIVWKREDSVLFNVYCPTAQQVSTKTD